MDDEISIFSYLDYRQFLKDFYRVRKAQNPHFTFRYMAQKTGLDHGHISRILQSRRHISTKSQQAFVKLLNLDDLEKSYFVTLVALNRTRSEQTAKVHFRKLQELAPPVREEVPQHQFEFYRKWYYSAIHGLVGTRKFRADDYERIAASLSPEIPGKQVEKAVSLLLKMGLVEIDTSGFLRPLKRHITTGRNWHSIAVRAFQVETIRLGMESIERHSREIRDISTLTLGFGMSDLPEIKERIAAFRNSLVHFVKNRPTSEQIYQLNIQFFPVTKKPERQK